MSIEKTYEGQWSSDPALLKSLLGKGFAIIAHDNRDECLVKINWTGHEYRATSSDGNYPVSEDLSYWTFLVPFPRPVLEPKPLEWKAVYMNEVGGAEIVAIDGYWSFYAWDNGGWMISIDGTCVHDGASGTDLNNGTFDTAKAAIHEWRVNHLKSMIQ